MTAESVPYATIPYQSFAGLDFPRDYPVITVEDGYRMNLGNRELTVLVFPHSNHTIGGLALLDPKERILFPGDEFLMANRAELIISLPDFAENVKHVEAYRKDFDTMWTGTGEKKGSVFDAYYKAATTGMERGYDKDASSLPEAAASGGPPKETPASDGVIIYTRGWVRPGDRAENTPEKQPAGTRRSYTVDGFSVSFVPEEK